MKWTYRYSWDNEAWDLEEVESIKAGDHVLVYSREHILKGWEEYRISKRFAETGYPGNSDPSYKTFHGWRGTTSDVAVYALGVYRVRSVEDTRNWRQKSGCLKIVLDKKDLKKNEE